MYPNMSDKLNKPNNSCVSGSMTTSRYTLFLRIALKIEFRLSFKVQVQTPG